MFHVKHFLGRAGFVGLTNAPLHTARRPRFANLPKTLTNRRAVPERLVGILFTLTLLSAKHVFGHPLQALT
jgi:hypothetical protein